MNSSQARRMIAAGMIGNVLEWYDFAIYGYFATAIGRHFFPHEDAVAQLLLAFGVSHAARRRRGDRTHRRPFRAARGAHLLGRRDGDPDLPDRASAGIRDAWPAG